MQANITKGNYVQYTIIIAYKVLNLVSLSQLVYATRILFLSLKCWSTTEAFFWPEGCHADSLPAIVVPLGKGRRYTSTQQLLLGLFQ